MVKKWSLDTGTSSYTTGVSGNHRLDSRYTNSWGSCEPISGTPQVLGVVKWLPEAGTSSLPTGVNVYFRL